MTPRQIAHVVVLNSMGSYLLLLLSSLTRVEINDVVQEAWVEVRHSMVKLTPDRVIYAGDTVKVSYTSAKHGAMQDHTGNVVASFGPVTAWNESRQARSSGDREDTNATR